MKKLLKNIAVISSMAALVLSAVSCASTDVAAAPAQEKTEAVAKAPVEEKTAPEGTLFANTISETEMEGMGVSVSSTKIPSQGSYSIWEGKGAIVSAAGKMALKIGKKGVDGIVSATNIDGATAKAVPAVGDVKTLVNYVQVATLASKESITINYSTNESSKSLEDASLSYWILITDESGKILAVKDIGDISQAQNLVSKVDVTFDPIEVGSKINVGFSRGAGSGGLIIHSIAQVPAL